MKNLILNIENNNLLIIEIKKIMKLESPKNKNYSAVVVELPNIRIACNGLDNLEAVSIFGYTVLVSKGSNGIGLFFPAETQLSDKFLYENNLYREDSRTGNLNKDKSSKGFFDKNGRVKAIKFKGNVSSGFFIGLDSLNWTGGNIDLLKVGDEFDFFNGNEICRKYIIPTRISDKRIVVDRGFKRADKKFMPEHIDTENFFRNAHKLNPNDEVIITQKLHGTSIRIANTMVNHKLSFIEKIAKLFGANIREYYYDYLYGSRKVIKDANNPNQKHFYEEDIWTSEGKKLNGIIPENYVIYGELIGWTPEGKPIQKGYTYGIQQNKCELFIYRITIVNNKGLITDLSWDQVKEFCVKNGLKYVPEIGKTILVNLTEDDFAYTKSLLDVRYFDEKLFKNCIWLGSGDVVDEGICIRKDGLIPTIFKAKSPKFLLHETKLLDDNQEDLESSQNINE